MKSNIQLLQEARKADEREKCTDRKIIEIHGDERTLKDLFVMDDMWDDLRNTQRKQVLMKYIPSLNQKATHFLSSAPLHIVTNILPVEEAKRITSFLWEGKFEDMGW